MAIWTDGGVCDARQHQACVKMGEAWADASGFGFSWVAPAGCALARQP